MNLRKNERLAELEGKVERLEKFMPIVEGCLLTLSEWLQVNQQFVLKLQSRAQEATKAAESAEVPKGEVVIEETPKTVTSDN